MGVNPAHSLRCTSPQCLESGRPWFICRARPSAGMTLSTTEGHSRHRNGCFKRLLGKGRGRKRPPSGRCSSECAHGRALNAGGSRRRLRQGGRLVSAFPTPGCGALRRLPGGGALPLPRLVGFPGPGRQGECPRPAAKVEWLAVSCADGSLRGLPGCCGISPKPVVPSHIEKAALRAFLRAVAAFRPWKAATAPRSPTYCRIGSAQGF